jgi:hypothetical protein
MLLLNLPQISICIIIIPDLDLYNYNKLLLILLYFSIRLDRLIMNFRTLNIHKPVVRV